MEETKESEPSDSYKSVKSKKATIPSNVTEVLTKDNKKVYKVVYRNKKILGSDAKRTETRASGIEEENDQ